MQDPYLHIEEYIAGNLSVEDNNAFEEAMGSDERLRQAVEDFDLVGLIGEALLEEEIAGIVGEEVGIVEEENKKKSTWLWILTFLGTALMAWIFWPKADNEPTLEDRHERLMVQYVYPENRGTRSLSKAVTKLDSAIYLFDLRKFDNSRILFEQVLEKDSLNQDANFYMAHISFLNIDYNEYCEYKEVCGIKIENIKLNCE